MPVLKTTIDGNSYVGAFAIANDSFAVFPGSMTQNKMQIISKALGLRHCATATVNWSDLIGIYIVANSKGVLLPNLADDSEVLRLRKDLPEVEVKRLDSDLNALGNNILANDRVALINPAYTTAEANVISDVLGVEVIKLSTGNFNTVGANNILTNKGVVVNNNTTEEEMDAVRAATGLDCGNSTANFGSLCIRLSCIANSTGLVVGEATTGFEAAKIAGILDV